MMIDKKDESVKVIISENLISFINNVINSYTAWDIITYLRMGSERKTASIDEIFDSIGREKKDILPVLESLHKSGYIVAKESKGKRYYTASDDELKDSQIKEFIRFAETREGRLKIIYYITKYRIEH